MIGAKRYLSVYWLFGPDPLLGNFNTVTTTVANDMRQRVCQGFQNRFVQFGLAAADGNLNLFVKVVPEFTDQDMSGFSAALMFKLGRF